MIQLLLPLALKILTMIVQKRGEDRELTKNYLDFVQALENKGVVAAQMKSKYESQLERARVLKADKLARVKNAKRQKFKKKAGLKK